MRVLVTGAAGFIGSHVVERLLDRGWEVVGVDNFDPFYSPDEKHSNLARSVKSPHFVLAELDLVEGTRFGDLLRASPVDAIVHLAAKAGVRPSILDPVGYARANVLGTQIVLTEARRHGIGRILFASSSSVYGNSSPVPFREDEAAIQPISPYAATKRAGELLCYTHQQLFGGNMLCLRFFTAYGPRQRPDLAIRKFATLIASGHPIPMFGDGLTERDYTWIADIVDGVVAALDRSFVVPDEFQVINLGGSRTTTLARLVALLGQELGTQPTIEHLAPQPGDVERTWADISKAKDLLGYAPTVAIEDGIARFAVWLRESLGIATATRGTESSWPRKSGRAAH